MNYFEFYGLPVSFFPDEEKLRKAYLAKSKTSHPDFFTLESADEQAEMLEQSTFNNTAYRTLSDFDRRMKYILELNGVMEEEGKNEIPDNFLSEMMDINEALMELEFDFDETLFRKVKEDVKNIENDLFNEVSPVLENYRGESSTTEELKKVKEFFFKKRYLLRILENLDRFAPASKEAVKN